MQKRRKGFFLKKLILSYTAIFMAVMLIFLLVFFLYVRYNSRNTANLTRFELAAQSLKQLENYLSDMENTAFQITTNDMFISLFSELKKDGRPPNYFKKNILASVDIRTELRGILTGRQNIWRVAVFNQYGDFISTGAVLDENLVPQILTERNVYAEMLDIRRDGKAEFILPEPDQWSRYYSGQYLTLRMPLMNIYTKEVYGLIEIQSDINTMHSLMHFEKSLGIEFSVKNEQETFVMRSKGIDNTKNITALKSEAFGWTVALGQSDRDLMRPYHPMIIIVFLGSTILLMLMIAAIAFTAYRISRPLIRLRKTVEKMTLGNMPESYEGSEKFDEVRELDSAFSIMLKNLNASMEQERKAAFFALQSQINPHFLYNTLAVISAQALESGNDKIIRMCDNISAMLRYTASYSEAVTVGDELIHLNNYLELMGERYEGYFEYRIHCDENLRAMLVPKLILQPLAENCFKHAFSKSEPPFVLRVYIGFESEHWIFEVEDNGAGISKEAKDMILNALKDIKNNWGQSYEKLEIGGLGLRSSLYRLVLYFGSSIDCKIENTEPSGTLITIKGPL